MKDFAKYLYRRKKLVALYTVIALWYIENGKRPTFYMNAVRKGVII